MWNLLKLNPSESLFSTEEEMSFESILRQIQQEDLISSEDVPLPISEDKQANVKNKKFYVVLFTGKQTGFDLISKGISFVTNSMYTHAAFALDDKLSTIYEMNLLPGNYLIKQLHAGFIKTNKTNLINQDRIIDVYSIPVSDNELKVSKKLVDILENKNQKGNVWYDYLSFFQKLIFPTTMADSTLARKQMLQKSVLDRGAFICSSLVLGILAASVKTIRNTLSAKKLDVFMLAPGDIPKIIDLKPETRLGKGVKPGTKIPKEVVAGRGTVN